MEIASTGRSHDLLFHSKCVLLCIPADGQELSCLRSAFTRPGSETKPVPGARRSDKNTAVEKGWADQRRENVQ